MFYVYLLKDLGVPFYVGKGTRNRMYRHITLAKKTNHRLPVLNKIRQMLSCGRVVEYEKVYLTENSQDAYNKEKEWIEKIGLENLKNLTYGGDGATRISTSQEHRNKISQGVKRAWKEGKMDDIFKNRDYNSDYFYKFKFSKLGKKDSPETRKRKSEGQKRLRKSGYKFSEETLEKLRKAGKLGAERKRLKKISIIESNSS